MLYDSLSPFQDNTGLFLMLSFLRFSLWPSLLSVPPLSHQLYSLSPAYRPLFSRSGKRVQWEVKLFVAATPTSCPALRFTTVSLILSRVEGEWFTTPSTVHPLSFPALTASSTSMVSPL